VSEVEAALVEVRKEVGGLEEEEAEIQKEQLEVKVQLEKFDNILKDSKAKLKHWKKEVIAV
jgi:Ni,Fe-hydrogenase III component G